MNLPRLNEKLQDSNIERNKLLLALYEAIDKFSKDSDYKLTYEEINAVLIKILSDNHIFMLKEMFQNEKI